MLWVGLIFLVIGLAWSGLKGYVVWDSTHTICDGGVPTLDFVIFCPIPLAFGGSLLLSNFHANPFPGFGFALYFVLAVIFGFIYWWFEKLGTPARKRERNAIHQSENEPHE